MAVYDVPFSGSPTAKRNHAQGRSGMKMGTSVQEAVI